MEDIGAALKDNGRITATDGSYTPAEVAFLRSVEEEIQSGEGAG